MKYIIQKLFVQFDLSEVLVHAESHFSVTSMLSKNVLAPLHDTYGDHQVGCGGNGDRISRHNTIQDVIFSAAQCAALASSLRTHLPGQLASFSLTGAIVTQLHSMCMS